MKTIVSYLVGFAFLGLGLLPLVDTFSFQLVFNDFTPAMHLIAATASLMILGWAIGLGIIITTGRARSGRMQARRDAEASFIFKSLPAKPIPYALYLRPFVSTNEVRSNQGWSFVGRVTAHALLKSLHLPTFFVPSPYEQNELEQHLQSVMAQRAPLIALGEPGEFKGAGRVKVPDASWQKAVRDLAEHAAIIFLVPHENPGTSWEVDLVLRGEYTNKTVIVGAPHVSRFREKQFDHEKSWTELVEIFAKHGFSLPEFDRQGQLIFFGRKMSPVLTSGLMLAHEDVTQKFLNKAIAASRRPISDPEGQPVPTS